MIESLQHLSEKKPGGEKPQGDLISVYVRRGMKRLELSFPQSCPGLDKRQEAQTGKHEVV